MKNKEHPTTTPSGTPTLLGLPLNAYWLGTWMMAGEGFGPQHLQDSANALRHAVSLGITQFDTSPIYGRGNADRLLAKLGGEMTIATKTGIHVDGRTYHHDGSPSFIHADIEASRRRLNRDVLDLAYLHWPDPNTPLLDSIDALQQLKVQGIVRAIGCSNCSVNDLDMIMNSSPIDVVQLKCSILDPIDHLRKIRTKWPSLRIVIYSIFEQGLLLNPTIKLTKSDQRHKNKQFSPTNRDRIRQDPRFNTPEQAKANIQKWLIALRHESKLVDEALIGVRTPDQLMGLMN